MADLLDFTIFQSITVKYSPDDMRCDVLFNGAPTPIYAKRTSYDAPFLIYVDHRPDTPILAEVSGWGVVGGISMLLDAFTAKQEGGE